MVRQIYQNRWKDISCGAGLGLAAGMSTATVDFCRAWSQPFAGDWLSFGLYVAAFLCTAGAVAGGCAELWLTWVSRVSANLSGHWARWTWTLGASIPLACFLLWVPSTWVTNIWDSLSGGRRSMVVAAHAGLLGLSVATICTTSRIQKHYRVRPNGLPRFHWPLVSAFLVLAGAFYWIDGNVYSGAYSDFHAGLAGVFVLALAAVCALIHAALRQGFLRSKRRARKVGQCARVLAVSATSVVVATEFVGPHVFESNGALVYSKVLSLARLLADFDRDGSPALFGGGDCAEFDARRGLREFDVPENGVDEDCSGRDARWPPRSELATPEPALSRLNLILITVDSLRADHLSAYGYARNTSPHLTTWASHGWRFARAFSQDTKTCDSLGSLFTGLYSSNLPRDYSHSRIRGERQSIFFLSPDVPVLTELLAAQGYRTHASSTIEVLATTGLDRGFHRFDATSEALSSALEFLGEASTPFFLWVHLFWPHYPYETQSGFDYGNSVLDRYDSEIARTDDWFGELLSTVRDRGIEPNTVIVFTADHGEEFGEHGGFHHGGPPYRMVTHVPLIIHIPGTRSRVIETPTELVDFVPTICELMGLQDDCDSLDGQSLLATAAGKRLPDNPVAYTENYDRHDRVQQRALHTGRWCLVQDLREGRIELYDTRRDPDEQQNIAYGNEAIWKPLLEQLSVRALRGTATLLSERDPARLLHGLQRIHSEPFLALALDRVARTDASAAERRPFIARLLARPGLSSDTRTKIEMLMH